MKKIVVSIIYIIIITIITIIIIYTLFIGGFNNYNKINITLFSSLYFNIILFIYINYLINNY